MASRKKLSGIFGFCLIFLIMLSLVAISSGANNTTTNKTFGKVIYDSKGTVVGLEDSDNPFSSTITNSKTLGGITYDSEGHVIDNTEESPFSSTTTGSARQGNYYLNQTD